MKDTKILPQTLQVQIQIMTRTLQLTTIKKEKINQKGVM